MAALSLNSLVCFTSSLANYHHMTRIDIGASAQTVTHLVSHPRKPVIRVLEILKHHFQIISPQQRICHPRKQGNSPANLRSTPIRSSRLTAREKLRAARVLSRKPEPKKAPKLQLGSQVLETLRESDKGKRRPGLPEAPTNMLDDSKRGMPKKGLTFELPGGNEVFFIILSVVLISTVMFSTTYLVWKVGAIHFNEN
ncbi:hypothetical protein POM88_048379 [Heracleum sosnowskyi]|uniref:Uncharacterized protein n=1 Tax=Heracleum sosnowskyi TaxID=360622 RepID=A0AAD8GW35_9APIA|nr:hypothetical protein POM88_048379 [Heracleum sosnowskyi]